MAAQISEFFNRILANVMIFRSFMFSAFPDTGKRCSPTELSQAAMRVRRPSSDACALDVAGIRRAREANPAKDTGSAVLPRCFREAPELADDVRIRCAARHRETDEVCVEEPAITVAAAAPARYGSKDNPVSAGSKDNLAIRCCPFRGWKWPPVVVMVFGFETADEAVGHREIYQCKQPGVLPHVELPCPRHFACDSVPTPG